MLYICWVSGKVFWHDFELQRVKILRNACAKFISTYIHKIWKESVSKQIDRVLIIVCIVEMNNFTCFVLFCVAFLNPVLSIWLIDHLWIGMLTFQDKRIKQVNFFRYNWRYGVKPYTINQYVYVIAFNTAKKIESVLLPHFTWDQSHKCWWIASFNKILADSET